MNHSEHLFRSYEPQIKLVIDTHPKGCTFDTVRNASYTRQKFKMAWDALLHNQTTPPSERWLTDINVLKAQEVYNEICFRDVNPSQFFVGPRRLRRQPAAMPKISASDTPDNSLLQSLVINCSNEKTVAAIFHLKNYDHLPFPIHVKELFYNQEELEALYPNTSLIPGALPGEYTIL